MQTSGKNIHIQFPECRLSYAKIMQTSGKNIHIQFPECRLSYAKIVIFGEVRIISSDLL